MLCLILAVCSQVSLFTSLSLGLLVDKMGPAQMELLRGLREIIPLKCVAQCQAHSRSSVNMAFPGPWTVGRTYLRCL